MKFKGNPAADLAVAIHERFGNQLHRFLVRRLRSDQDAGDLAQEVYLRLLSLKRTALVGKPQAYVYIIASRVAAEFMVRAGRNPVSFDSETVEQVIEDADHVLPDELAEHLNDKRLIARMLERLPAMHRAVLLLHKRDGLSYGEVARKLGISVHTVKKYLYEAKARIAAVKWNR
jgi:RNA polymerase sigma-19 factor, ECF subfamily